MNEQQRNALKRAYDLLREIAKREASSEGDDEPNEDEPQEEEDDPTLT